MKRFNFRLQSVLQYREYLEQLAQQETARAHMKVKNSETRINELRLHHLDTVEELETTARKGINASDFKKYHDYLDALDSDIELEIKKKAGLEKILVEKQENLTKKSVNRKVIEKLKDKKDIEYMDELRKDEQKILDEISSLKKVREINDAAT